MTHHAKAPSARSIQRQAGRLGRIFSRVAVTGVDARGLKGSSAPFFMSLALAAMLSLLLASAAGAATVTERPLLFTFNGTGATGPLAAANSVAVDNATGNVYIAEQGSVVKLNSNGTPVNFSATGSPLLSIPGSPPLGIAVDNTGGATQGRLLVSIYSEGIYAYSESGAREWFLPESNPYDVAVDKAGHIWAPHPNEGRMREYANTGNPPAGIFNFVASGSRVDADANGNVYVGGSGPVKKYVNGVFSSTLDPSATNIYADQTSSSGHLFTVDGTHNEAQEVRVSATAGQYRLSFGGKQTPDLAFNASSGQVRAALEALPSIGASNVEAFELGTQQYMVRFTGKLAAANLEELVCENGTTPLSGGTGCTVSTQTQGAANGNVEEYDASGTHLGTFGTTFIFNGTSVAYNHALDRVYVLEGGAGGILEAFGPSVTGTVPDATIEAPSAVGISTAHFAGKVNPQGTSSEWRFQWRRLGQSWNEGGSSPAQSLPVDSNEHTVEYTTNALRGGNDYRVRLVAVNTANQLSGVSAEESFTTTAATQAPAVTINNPSAITAHTAKVTGTINPRGDTADWRVQTSTDPACTTGFTNRPMQEVTPASSSPVNVEYELTGLLPSQYYCARIVATNSAGTTTSEAKSFTTLDTTPTQVFSAYASWRTDTTARLNGYVNPEGSEITYRFEYSQDGSNWTTLPDMTSSRRSREQIVVAEEVTGLQPNTTYHYRFSVENGAGLEEGEAKEFTTRTSAEAQAPQRGAELVNPPDKGNQNIGPTADGYAGGVVSPEGNRVVWQLLAGAPGGNSGTHVNFISDRTPSGWASRPMIPPAEEQYGGGSLTYVLNAATPDLRHFVLHVGLAEALQFSPPTFVRLDDAQHQEVLKTLTEAKNGLGYANVGFEISDNGAHVLWVNYETEQLEELTGGASEVLSIMPEGQPNECGLSAEDFSGAASEGPGAQWNVGYHRMDATNASRLYFQAVPNGQPCSGPKAIFYRDRETDETIEIDPGAGTVGARSEIIRATPDGKSLYFATTVSHVTEDTNGAGDVYRWDSEGDQYTCLTCVVPNAELGSGGSFSRFLISDDFSHIYFISSKQLVPGHGAAGTSNLYVLRNGEVGFVVSGAGVTPLERGELSANGNVLVWNEESGKTQLTADEVATKCSNGGKELGDCHEVYRYEDGAESVECLSCVPGGTTTSSAGGTVGVTTPAIISQSADGSTAAFVTREPLVEEDINNAPDVYEWRGGAARLITDGETPFTSQGIYTPPRIYGVDSSGQNIFFTVVDKGLTGYEQDGLANLYDARIGGGFPRPQAPQHCSEESCQGPLQTPPGQAASGSSHFSGAGNVAPPKGRCAGKRGKARIRCLHPHKHKHRGHKRRAAQRAAKHGIGGAK